MQYWIWLRSGNGEPYIYSDSVLPGVVPSRVIDLLLDRVVDEDLGLCATCDVRGQRCHVIECGTGRKFCPVLFSDVFQTAWRVADVL